MKKQLNENTIVNELRGSSAFFPTSPQQTHEQENARIPEHLNTGTGERLNGRTPEQKNSSTPVQTNPQTAERQIVRHSFNFYRDQIAALRRQVAVCSLDGEQITLSDLVRQALDDFLRQQPERQTNR